MLSFMLGLPCCNFTESTCLPPLGILYPSASLHQARPSLKFTSVHGQVLQAKMQSSARSGTAVAGRAASGRGSEVRWQAPRGCPCQAGAGLVRLLKLTLLRSCPVLGMLTWCASKPGPPACAKSMLVGGLWDEGVPTAGVAARQLPVLRSHCASCPGALSVCQTRIHQTATLLKCLMLMVFSASGCLECWLSKYQLEPCAEVREVCGAQALDA